MSTSVKRLSLSNPIVIAVVLVLLVVVGFANVRTFMPQIEMRSQQKADNNDYPEVPLDLQQVLARSAGAGLSPTGTGRAATPSLRRDPFARPAPKSTPRPVKPKPATSAKVVSPDTLVCAAVMLGGKIPLALINGQTLVLGDRIRDFQVVGISTDGVQLQDDKKQTLFLEVGRKTEFDRAYKMVTKVTDQKDLGRTALQEK